MLDSIRKFTKSFWAKILLVIMIIPFVFWGMGSAFQGGNTNTVAKIDSYNISTKEFIEHMNYLNLDSDFVKENIDNSILEQLLSDLINKTIISMQSSELNINISDNSLSKIIKKNKKFFNTNNQFSRTKYEKFLITNNLNAMLYEKKLKNEQMNKLLFNYISGGTFPPDFLVKETYNYQNKKLNVKAISLNTLYKKEKDFNEKNIKDYINNNSDKLKEDFITFRFATINPLTLINSDKFNELFFEKIDEIETLIINDSSFESISKKFNLKTESANNISKNKENINGVLERNLNQKLVDKIFNLKFKDINSVNLLEYENEYALLIIDNIQNTIANINSKSFKKKIIRELIKDDIFKNNSRLITKIKTNSFKESEFIELAKTNQIEIVDILINGIRDNNFFSEKNISQIFKLKENSFAILNEIKKNKIFLIWINDIENAVLSKNLGDYNKYYNETIIRLKNDIYSSFDLYLNEKYKVVINYKTLDRLKNSFR